MLDSNLDKILKNWTIDELDSVEKIDTGSLVYQIQKRQGETQSPQDANLIEEIVGTFLEKMDEIYGELPVQLIHRDPHPGNMIFLDGELSGYIDFDISVRGIKIFDLCYCSTSMLMDAYGDEERQRCWFEILQALLQGYQEAYELTDTELEAVWYVLLAIQLTFAAYFYEKGEMELAEKNRDVLLWLYWQKGRVEGNYA